MKCNEEKGEKEGLTYQMDKLRLSINPLNTITKWNFCPNNFDQIEIIDQESRRIVST